jgi:integrase
MLIRRHLIPALGKIARRDLRPEYLQHFYNEKSKENLSPRSVQLMHTVLHGALSQAEKNQMVARNVSKLISRPQGVRKDVQTLTAAQVSTSLLPMLKEDRLFAVIYLAFGTRLRRGELLALRWQDVDLNEGVLQVCQTLARVNIYNEQGGKMKTQLIFQQPKTANSRRKVPIPDACLMALKRHKAKQAEEKLSLGPAYVDYGLVVCQPDGKPIDPRNFLRYFKRVLERAGLPNIRLHDARHTFATMMLELGESPKTVQTMLGDSRVGIILDIYSHVSLELEKKAAAKLNAALSVERSIWVAVKLQ